MNQISNKQEYPKNNREHKSSVFCKVFSNKEDLLDLYNALNETDYQNPEALEMYTLENVVYITMKNDVAFIVDCTLNLYEHQSTFNPNMPLRGLLYFAQEYNRYIETNDINLFSTSVKTIPTPEYIVFFNGNTKQPDKKVLYLSDAFENKTHTGCLECKATMININFDHNKQLMEKCRKLKEYTIFVDTVRKFTLQTPKNPRKALSLAIEECIENDILRNLLVSQKAEVLELVLTTFNKELYEKELKEEAIAAGLAEGREKGLAEGLEKGRTDFLVSLVQKKLNKNLSVSEIAKELEQTVDEIQSIIDELNKK